MKKQKRFIKYFIAIFILAVLAVCIWGIPLKETTIFVKSDGTNVTGKFTGTWSPVTGKKGIFTAEEGWIFEGIINPDGGLWEGQLINYPFSPEAREKSIFDLPEFYTGKVEESVLVDVDLTACQDVENDAVKPMDIVKKFFLAFEVSDYQTMKKYCTESCIETYFHEGNVDGMVWAKLTEPAKEEIVNDYVTRIFVTVEMETAETSALYPATKTSFYVEFIYSDGLWLINAFPTG